jgi:FMN phosphatase YigB (HAD superfamily)
VRAPISLVIFDCDGVLVDTERIAVRIDVVVLAALGWTMTESEVIERFMGRSDEEMTREIEAHLGRRLPASWEEPFRHLYREAFEAELAPVPGILEALDAIALPTCVASSGTHEKIRFTLRLTGLYERFAGRIFSASEVARGKPARICFSTRRAAWRSRPPAARSWRIVATVSKPPARPACVRSAMPEASRRGARSRVRKPLFSMTCGSSLDSSRATRPAPF